MWPALVPARAGWGDAVTGISRADSASANATTLRQRLRRCNRSGRLGQSAVGCRVAQPVSSADGTMNVGPNRRLTHRRASLALEAPIARPWISLPERPLRDCSAFTLGSTRVLNLQAIARPSQRVVKMIKQLSDPSEPFQRVIAGRLPKHFARDWFLS